MRSHTRISAVLLLAALLAVAARALPPPWVPLGPFGGYVQTLTADPSQPGTLYAVTPAGIFKTVDGGGTWTLILLKAAPVGPGIALTVDPAHSSTLYFVTYDITFRRAEVLKSTDGGASWASSGAGLPFLHFPLPANVAVDPADPRRLLLTYSHKLWQSPDAGASWQPSTRGLPATRSFTVQAVAFAAHPAGTAFAATSAGLFRTTDAGLSWKRVDRGLPVSAVDLLALAPTDPRTVYVHFAAFGLYRSADGGFSWQRAAAPSKVFGAALAVSPQSPRTLYSLSADGTLFRSTDGGARWSPVSGVPGVTSVAFDAAAPQRVYAGSKALPLGGVWRSDDSGASWARRSQGIASLPAYALAIDPQDPDRLWAEGTALFRSENRGTRWARATSPSSQYTLTDLAVAASSDLLAAVPAQTPRGLVAHSVFKTTDGGASWRPVLDSSQADVRRIHVAPSDPSTIYVTENDFPDQPSRLWRSMDNGETWEPLFPSVPSPNICASDDLAVAPSSAAVLYLSRPSPELHCERALFRSGDGGATWVSADAGLTASLGIATLAVDPRDPDRVYASTFDRVWRSADGGRSWSSGAGIPGQSILVLLASAAPDRLYAAVVGQVFRSDDGGATWQSWSQGLQTSFVFSLTADPQDPHRIYAATSNGVWVLTETD